MKYFINTKTNEVFAYEADDSQDFLIFNFNEDGTKAGLKNPDLKRLTKAEYEALNETPEKITLRKSERAKVELERIDLKSVRALREYVAAQANAPAQLKTLEAEAILKRLDVV